MRKRTCLALSKPFMHLLIQSNQKLRLRHNLQHMRLQPQTTYNLGALEEHDEEKGMPDLIGAHLLVVIGGQSMVTAAA